MRTMDRPARESLAHIYNNYVRRGLSYLSFRRRVGFSVCDACWFVYVDGYRVDLYEGGSYSLTEAWSAL
jgi:hypothetical protein